MSLSKLTDILADIRIDPSDLGRQMAFQDNIIQERAFIMFSGFIKELAAQDQLGSYVNGNMELAQRGRGIQYLLTDNQLV